MGIGISLLFLFILVAAGLFDLIKRKIPNLITYPAMVSGLAYHGLSDGFKGMLFSVEGLALGSISLIGFYIFSGMGAGDVKLMGAVGAFLGPKGVFIAFICTALIGGLVSLGVIIFRPTLKATVDNISETAKSLFYTRKLILPTGIGKKRIPYGPVIAMGSTIAIIL